MSLLIKSLFEENRKITNCKYVVYFLKNAKNRVNQQAHIYRFYFSCFYYCYAFFRCHYCHYCHYLFNSNTLQIDLLSLLVSHAVTILTMSLFDFIENDPESEEARPEKEVRYQPVNHSNVEKLAFLKPCPLCSGKDFISKQKGGFFCIKCQPNQKGIRVFAAGNRKKPGKECDTLHEQVEKKPSNTQRKVTAGNSPHFQTALPWIMDHLEELQKIGWTRPSLFRHGKHRFPIGVWGVAWFLIWTKANLQINICKRSGAIRFSFTGTDGRKICQTAYPPQGNR